MYGHKCILRPIRHFDRIGIRGVSVPRVFFSALGFSGRLFHNQRLSFSSLNRESEGEIRGIFECVGNLGFFYCVPYYVIDMSDVVFFFVYD